MAVLQDITVVRTETRITVLEMEIMATIQIAEIVVRPTTVEEPQLRQRIQILLPEEQQLLREARIRQIPTMGM